MPSRLEALLAEQARRQSEASSSPATASQPSPSQPSRLDILMAEKAKRENQPSSPEAVLRGVGQGATLNFGDEITGAIGAVTDPISRGLERMIWGDNVLREKGYADYRNETRQRNQAAQQAHPNFYLAGEFTGGAMPAILTGGTTAAPSISRMAATGAGWGGASGLGASEEEGLAGMAKDTAIGATLGGGLGAGLGALSKFAPIQKVKNLGQTIGSFFSDDIAANKANRIIANEITDSGMDTVGARLAQRDAQKMGMGTTLPEALGNERLIRYQHDIATSGTKGADILAQQAEKRAKELIPAKTQELAKDIRETAGPLADEAYDAIRSIPIDKEIDDVARQHPLIKRAIAAVENNPVYRSEPLGLNTMGFYDRVRDELGDMASTAINKGATRKAGIITDVKNQLTSLMDSTAPEYAEARRLAQRNIAGREIQDALENAQVGSVSGFKNALFGTPAKQADILRKLEPHEQKALQDIMGELEKMEKSGLTDTLGSSGGALKEGVMPRETRVVTGTTSATTQMFNWVMDKIHQKNYKALAEAFVNPDMRAITQQIAKTQRGAEKKALIDEFATKFLSTQAGRETTEPNERTKITITPPTPAKIQGIYEKEQEGGGAGNDKLSPDIVHAEGLRLKAYNDSLGKKTVGYGFNMDDPSARKRWAEAGLKTPFQAVKRGRLAITPQEAKQLANYSYKIAANDAKKLYPNFSKLSKNRQQALINMSYQMGLTNLSGFKDANKAIANGRFNAAVRHFAKSRWVRQTPERAKKILTMLWKDVPYDKA